MRDAAYDVRSSDVSGTFLETDVREHLGIVRQFTSDEAPLKAALI